jgi:hypothetical protein
VKPSHDDLEWFKTTFNMGAPQTEQPKVDPSPEPVKTEIVPVKTEKAKPKSHHHNHHRSHRDIFMKGFDFDTDNMTQEQMINKLDIVVAALSAGALIWFLILYLSQQALFMFAIKRVIRSQKVLENHFMGPEVTNSQGAIQYIQEPPLEV